MSVDYNIPTINDRLLEVVANIDAGTTNGWMRLLDGGGTILSSFQLSRPMGTVAGGVLTFNGLSIIDPAAAATGTPTSARVEDGDGTVVISGLVVGGNSPDILVSHPGTITAGQVVALTAATITGR